MVLLVLKHIFLKMVQHQKTQEFIQTVLEEKKNLYEEQLQVEQTMMMVDETATMFQ